jgi:hypothetical protein
MFSMMTTGRLQFMQTNPVLGMSTPVENLTGPPDENLTDRRGDEPQFVVAS